MLLTSVDPLTIWFFDDCYIRFAAEDYENGNKGENKFSHLTNNSIAKYSKKDDKRIPGNMWDTTQFSQYLIKLTGRDVYNEKIKPDMKKIVKYSL